MEPLQEQSPLEVITQETEVLGREANALVIRTDRDYETAGQLAGRIKKCSKSALALLDPEVKRKHAEWKAAVAFRDGYLEPLAAHEGSVKGKMAAFIDAREGLRLKLETEAREAARKLAEEEAGWRAEQLWERGDEEGALDLLDNPPVPSASIASLTPAAEGISPRTTWKWEVEDFGALVAAAATDPSLLAVLSVDHAAMNKLVDALRDRASIPGVRVFPKKSVAVRS